MKKCFQEEKGKSYPISRISNSDSKDQSNAFADPAYLGSLHFEML